MAALNQLQTGPNMNWMTRLITRNDFGLTWTPVSLTCFPWSLHSSPCSSVHSLRGWASSLWSSCCVADCAPSPLRLAFSIRNRHTHKLEQSTSLMKVIILYPSWPQQKNSTAARLSLASLLSLPVFCPPAYIILISGKTHLLASWQPIKTQMTSYDPMTPLITGP